MKYKIILLVTVVLLTVLPSKAQRIEIAATPLAAVWSIPEFGAKYNNAYGLILSVYKTDSSLLRIQLRYDYFEAKFDPISGLDNSFHNVGIGVSRRLGSFESFDFSAFALLGFSSSIQVPVATPVVRDSLSDFQKYTSKAPSSVNVTLGMQAEWLATKRLAPFIEASLLNSLKLKTNEKTQMELFALRFGVRLKL